MSILYRRTQFSSESFDARMDIVLCDGSILCHFIDNNLSTIVIYRLFPNIVLCLLHVGMK